MELKGSKTEKNLMEAFAGESQARNKYTYYASKAKKEGYNIIADKFEQTANNEKEHAKLWFKLLHGGAVPSTMENLKDAAAGENYEWTDMYDRMAKEARKNSFKLMEEKKSPRFFCKNFEGFLFYLAFFCSFQSFLLLNKPFQIELFKFTALDIIIRLQFYGTLKTTAAFHIPAIAAIAVFAA